MLNNLRKALKKLTPKITIKTELPPIIKDPIDVVTKAGKDTINTLDKGFDDIKNTVGKGLDDGKKTINKGLDDSKQTLEKGINDGGKTVGKGIEDFLKTTGKTLDDTKSTIDKAINDTGKELGRGGDNINEAAVAAGSFLENQFQATGEILSDAEKRLREGKLVDAIWHLTTDPLTHTEDNLGEALTESSLLNSIASAAASVYGGPPAAAAYAAWYTYKVTGDLELALKTGIITGATAKGLKMVNGMPSESTGLVKKTLASASIGAAAVAASGGEEKEIIEAFVKGAAYTAARESYSKMTKEEISGRAPTKSAETKLDPNKLYKYKILTDQNGKEILDAHGNIQIDITSMPRDVSHVGLATSDPNPGIISLDETSPLMTGAAKVPYINDMAYYHDQWAAVTQMSGLAIPGTIFPATILTVTGTDSPLIQDVINENIESDEKND